jgi:hypothetical protein
LSRSARNFSPCGENSSSRVFSPARASDIRVRRKRL